MIRGLKYRVTKQVDYYHVVGTVVILVTEPNYYGNVLCEITETNTEFPFLIKGFNVWLSASALERVEE